MDNRAPVANTRNWHDTFAMLEEAERIIGSDRGRLWDSGHAWRDSDVSSRS